MNKTKNIYREDKIKAMLGGKYSLTALFLF